MQVASQCSINSGRGSFFAIRGKIFALFSGVCSFRSCQLILLALALGYQFKKPRYFSAGSSKFANFSAIRFNPSLGSKGRQHISWGELIVRFLCGIAIVL